MTEVGAPFVILLRPHMDILHCNRMFADVGRLSLFSRDTQASG